MDDQLKFNKTTKAQLDFQWMFSQLSTNGRLIGYINFEILRSHLIRYACLNIFLPLYKSIVRVPEKENLTVIEYCVWIFHVDL